MGFKNKLGLFGQKKYPSVSCKFNEDGTYECERKRELSDGNVVIEAGFIVGFDADCRAVVKSSYENVPGALDELEKKVLPKVITKCKRDVPQDY